MGSTISAPSAPSVGRLLGEQRPRLWSVPPAVGSAGREAVDLARQAGLDLDDWQAWVLEQSLGERADGTWSAFEVGLIVSRQNGKGAILEARELAGLFLLDEQLILHSAHEFKTAAEAFRRIRSLIEGSTEFSRRVKHVYTAIGNECIELLGGRRLRFVARTGGSGRGFSGDCVILDEAQHLDHEAMGALLPTLSARPNPQVWYTATAGKETSVQLGRVRERGRRGNDPSLAFFEWSVDFDDGEAYDPADVTEWARANPGLGIRISAEYIANERRSLDPDTFARERLGVGNYPVDLTEAWQVIPRKAWDRLADNDSELEDPVTFAVGVRPDERSASIAVAGKRSDGHLFVEVVEHRPGTSWVTARMGELDDQWSPCAIVVDVGGPAGSLVSDLENVGLRIVAPQVRQVSDAAEQFYDLVMDSKSLRHLGDVSSQRPLRQALGAATKRALRDKWTWERRHPTVDMSPLEAVTLAAWGYGAYGGELGPDDVVVRAV
jgi:Phage Terminase